MQHIFNHKMCSFTAVLLISAVETVGKAITKEVVVNTGVLSSGTQSFLLGTIALKIKDKVRTGK